MGLFGDELNLPRLVERCRRGDRDAWETVVRAHQALVYSIARRYGLSEEDSADVFQSTFAALHRHLDRLENAQTLPKWLAVTASREAIKIKRINARTVGEDASVSLDQIVAVEEANAEENAIRAVRAEQIRVQIQALKDRCRQLLTLLYLEEETSYSEISESLGMPVGAIGPTRARCLKELRKRLDAMGFFGDDVSGAGGGRS